MISMWPRLPKLTYTIAFIRLHGVSAKDHPIFRELSRVKQYFEKLKGVETLGQKPINLHLNQAAADRVIKHALVGGIYQSSYFETHYRQASNKQYDIARAQKLPNTNHASKTSASASRKRTFDALETAHIERLPSFDTRE